MTLEEAQAFIDSRKAWELEVESDDSFRIKWAKFSVANHKSLLARCQTDHARSVVKARFMAHCGVLMEHLLNQ